MGNFKKMESRNRLMQLQSELDQIMAEMVEPGRDRFAAVKRNLDVQVDVYETETTIHVRAELPGVAKEDIQVFLSRDMLYIEGNKKTPYSEGEERKRFLNLERDFGRFKREVGIPKPVDGREIRAWTKGGILFVEMLKISDRRGKRKRIPIE